MKKRKDTTISDEFMLAYFPTTYQRHYYERESGEKSFNSFLTLSSAIIGGMLLLVSNLGMNFGTYIIILSTLSFVFLFGFVIFDRICSRIISGIRWIARANLALTYFIEQDKKLGEHIKLHRINEITETLWKTFSLQSSGLARVSAIINSTVGIGITLISLKNIFYLDLMNTIVVSALSGIVIWILHVVVWRRKIVKFQRIEVPFVEQKQIYVSKKKTK